MTTEKATRGNTNKIIVMKALPSPGSASICENYSPLSASTGSTVAARRDGR